MCLRSNALTSSWRTQNLQQYPPQNNTAKRKRILVLSAYDTESHRLWRTRLESMLPAFDWQHLSLPARNFSFRIRSNSLQWAFGDYKPLQEQYDAILATSMVDLASLRGLRPALAQIPTVVYFHENQFDFPLNRQRASNIEPKLVPIYAALCADRVVFNSEYNRSSFLSGVKRLLKSLPDKLDASIINKLAASLVIPVPLASREFCAPPLVSDDPVLEVLWNHRWEHDKGPELLLNVLEKLQQSTLPVRFHLAGKQFRNQPGVFADIDATLDAIAAQRQLRRGQFGFLPDRQLYLDLLKRCDVVLSTALHEFQGLALQEACALGCTPVAPDRLVYPEYLSSEFLYRVCASSATTAEAIVQRLSLLQSRKACAEELPKASMRLYLDTSLKASYEDLLNAVMKK